MSRHRGPLGPIRAVLQLGEVPATPIPADGTAWKGYYVVHLAAYGSARGVDLYFTRPQLEVLLRDTPEGVA